MSYSSIDELQKVFRDEEKLLQEIKSLEEAMNELFKNKKNENIDEEGYKLNTQLSEKWKELLELRYKHGVMIKMD